MVLQSAGQRETETARLPRTGDSRIFRGQNVQYLILQLRFNEAARIPRPNTVPNEYTWDKSNPKKNQEQYSLQDVLSLGAEFGLHIGHVLYSLRRRG